MFYTTTIDIWKTMRKKLTNSTSEMTQESRYVIQPQVVGVITCYNSYDMYHA
jgi:hypothetical protein